MYRFVLLACVALLAACPGDDEVVGADAATCSCDPQTAAQTSYDNSSSGLGGTNVQGALDDLAGAVSAVEEIAADHEARLTAVEGQVPPLQAIGAAIEFVTTEFPNSGAVSVSPVAACPNEAHDIAIGGACLHTGASASLVITNIIVSEGVARFQCRWHQSEGATEPLEVTVVCLRNAR